MTAERLLARLAHLSRIAAPFYLLPMDQWEATHKQTGLPNWHIYVLIIEAIGKTVHELSELQEVSQ